METPRVNNTRICRLIGTPRGCRFGASCKFLHPSSQPLGFQGTQGEASNTQPPSPGQNSDDAFYRWRRLIPRTSANGSQPFGFRLPQFFQTAHTLVQSDLETMQKTVAELATERGCLAIREMIDERIPFCPSDFERVLFWRTCVRPLFLVLTEPQVVRSVILEVHLGTIYNVILGSNAARLEILFDFLRDLAMKWNVPLIQYDDGPKSQFLEICTAVLAKVVDCNTHAMVNHRIPPIVARLCVHVESLGQNDSNFWGLQATKHLEYIQRRLGIVKGVAKNTAPKARAPKHASFVLRRDLPGRLSDEGPRHDNDFEDITKIRILPTMSEIMSTREDYRPFCDLSQLHLPGIKGLIDRHFRLLREDMISHLKETINDELQLLEHPDSKTIVRQQSSIRINSYNVVDIMDVTYTRRFGLEFHVKIEQPLATSRMTGEARQDWWNFSKRLEIGALVCFLEKGTAIFCVVSESTIRPNQTRKASGAKGEASKTNEKADLFSNKDFAYVNLNLAEPSDIDVEAMLLTFQLPSNQRSLVEFPGILLPSFKPTLSALQQIYNTLDLPFTDLLAPPLDDSAEANIPPPLYAMKPGFAFNLESLTFDKSDLMVSPQNSPDPQELCKRSSLDKGQATALLNALKRSLSLIQGPPGTGKSYTGEAIIKVLLSNKKTSKIGPILCVCYTNHALDQLLEHLWEGGVKQIIRIGSRSKSSLLETLNLREVGKDAERTKAEKHAVWKHGTELSAVEGDIKTCLDRLKTATSTSKVKGYIKTHAELFHDVIFGVEEQGWTLVTPKDELSQLDNWINAGYSSKYPTRDIGVLKILHPDDLTRQERVLLCDSWGSEMVTDIVEEFVSLHDKYQEARKGYQTVLREVDLRVLQEADIIGVTTTGLAKNLDLLRKLDTKVLVCEEAGEVLESHILTALLPSVEHAILIGDHLQLRPQVANYELSAANPIGKQYSLDVSLFERLVQPARPTDLRLPFDTLEIQRRMHPSISTLIKDTLYRTLKDAQKVEDYPQVVGMRRRLFWFDHNKPEARSDPSHPSNTSRTNDFEVGMVCALLSHLVRQGVYDRDDIAVLTPYLGQLQKLRKRLQKSFEVVVNDKDLDDLQREGLDTAPEVLKKNLGSCLRLATVDNFQGEEAKVVIISLVRSNAERQCGFLRTENRINVLLSRAMHGMFIFGNSATYGTVDMWSKVIDMLKKNGNIGTKLQLQCPRHKDKPIEIAGLDDFARLAPEAGCNLQCFQRLDCGHTCRSKCHAAPLHKAVKCLEPCQRLKKACRHGCPKLCGEPCEEKCSALLKGQKLALPCGHVVMSPRCWQVRVPHEIKCRETMEKVVPGCSHRVKVPCYEDVTKNGFVCRAECGKLLRCGHACKDTCNTCRTREDGEVKKETHRACKSVCGRNYTTCRHACGRKCHGDEDCPQCEKPCEIQCCHSRCSKKCSEPCTPCAMVTCSSICPHGQCTMPCAAPCNWIPCSKRCGKFLSCGHKCPSLCGEACPDAKYCQVCASEEIKAAVADMLELREYREIDLDIEPCIFPDCGHMMTVSSMDGQLGMLDHYDSAEDGTIIAVKSPLTPLSDTVIRGCPHCRGSLRNISRYGRIVRQALLDESTKKFISWSNSQAVTFERRLFDEQAKLEKLGRSSRFLKSIGREGDLGIIGEPVEQLRAIRDWVQDDRYRPIIRLYVEMLGYLDHVKIEEQPYRRVYDSVQHARQSGETAGEFTMDSSKVQTKGQLLAQALIFRCYLAVLSDLLQSRRAAKQFQTIVHFDPKKATSNCEELIKLAHETNYIRQETEGCIFYAKFIAIARQISTSPEDKPTQEVPDSLVERAKLHLANAEALVGKHSLTEYLRTELDSVKVMLYEGVFYNEVTSAEKSEVWLAMSRELSGTGHWYTCAQGHPFTIANCGLPMQEARCPECGAPIGGRDHQLTQGVQRDEAMDELGVAAARLRI